MQKEGTRRETSLTNRVVYRKYRKYCKKVYSVNSNFVPEIVGIFSMLSDVSTQKVTLRTLMGSIRQK